MRLLLRSVLLATVAISVLPPLARAQVDSREGIALQNQIYQLRQEMRQMQDQRGGGQQQGYAPQPRLSGNASDLLTQLLTRVDSLEDQVRQLRGRVDELQNQVQQQSLDLNKKIDDLKFQVGSGSGQSSGQASLSQMPPPQMQPQPGSITSPPPGSLSLNAGPAPTQLVPPSRPSGPRTPELAMQEGNAALLRRDYPAAEAAAREVLANRTSPRAYDAKVLLAKALEGEKQFPQAAVAYDDAYNMSRKGSHAQDALLGLATSLTAIKENKAACDTLGRMRSDFPQVRADLQAGVAATAQKAGCR
jgi:TolA-binding protein